MVSAKFNGALVGFIAIAGLAWGQTAGQPGEKKGQDLMMVQEAGKPNQQCLILKSWQQPDGSLAFEVQSLEGGERMTIIETGPENPTPGTPAAGMHSHIYHWGNSVTPPLGVPQPAVEQPNQQVSPPPAVTAAPVPIITSVEGLSPVTHEAAAEQKAPSSVGPMTMSKSSSDNPASSISDPKLGPIQIETAKPNDWRQSWGKLDHEQPAAAVHGEKKDAGVKACDMKVSTSESAAEAAPPSAPKPSPAPAGYVSVSDMPPRSKSLPASQRSGKGLFSRILKPGPMAQPTTVGPMMAAGVAQPVGFVQANDNGGRLQLVLAQDLMPSHREEAAAMLAAMDWHHDREILPAILKAAGEDPAATVRAGCVRCLAKMRADTPEAIQLLRVLQADTDARVRDEAEKALAALGVQQIKESN